MFEFVFELQQNTRKFAKTLSSQQPIPTVTTAVNTSSHESSANSHTAVTRAVNTINLYKQP